MQSVLQYYSFRAHLRSQLHRHEEETGQGEKKGSNETAAAGAGTTAVENRPEDESGSDASLDRPSSNRVAPEQEVNTRGAPLGSALTGVHSKVLTNEDKKLFIVGYEGPRDDLNPHNWSYTKRWVATLLVANVGFVVGIASSIDASGIMPAAAEFGVSEVAESLATGLYLIGFGVGSLTAGPFSEDFGRNPVYIVTLILYMCFVLGTALAPNFAAQIIFRFIAGFFGATPLVVAGGSMSDLWTPMERTYTFPVFANAAFIGPVLGGTVGGFITESYLGFRWNDWITLIWSALILVLILLFQPETYAPTLLKWKAIHLRKITGNDKYYAPIEVRQETLLVRLRVALYKPFLILFRELIVVFVAIYLSVIYIILFGFFSSFEFIFGQVHGLSGGVVGLVFLGIIVGLCLSSLSIPFVYRHYKKTAEASKDGQTNPPEARLILAMCGGWTIPVSLFWMGWTDYPSISVWAPISSTVFFGFGILCVFISSYQYIIDAYEINAASALASVTLLRYIVAGVMVTVSIPMFENLGVQWACTLLALLSAAMVPVPFIFFRYGHAIRGTSKYATS